MQDDRMHEQAALVDQLRDALLEVEWEWWHDGRHGELHTADTSPYKVQEFQGPWCPCCEAEVGNKFPADQKHSSRCRLDKALTACGLPDQKSRDKARAQAHANDPTHVQHESAKLYLACLEAKP